jgi:hypothetical protein
VIEHPLWFENNQILLCLLTRDLREKDRGNLLVMSPGALTGAVSNR